MKRKKKKRRKFWWKNKSGKIIKKNKRNEKKSEKLKMDKSFTRYLILIVPGKEQQNKIENY